MSDMSDLRDMSVTKDFQDEPVIRANRPIIHPIPFLVNGNNIIYIGAIVGTIRK
jgi:hypothetical protein